jgi:hypothetical protein
MSDEWKTCFLLLITYHSLLITVFTLNLDE